MKKKIVIILLFVLLITGCQSEYSLVIDDDKIVESFDTIVADNDENNESLKYNRYPLHADNNIVYDKVIKKENNMLNVHFEYTYKPYDFVNANMINNCFESKKIIIENDYYYIHLLKYLPTNEDLNFTISIITNNKVLKNNADKVKGDKYIWYLTESNKDTFNLEIKIAKGKKKMIISPTDLYLILSGVIFALLFIIFIFRKIRTNNKI